MGWCRICNGNDADVPCAYSTERPAGCLRVHRLVIEAAAKRVAKWPEWKRRMFEAFSKHPYS